MIFCLLVLYTLSNLALKTKFTSIYLSQAIKFINNNAWYNINDVTNIFTFVLIYMTKIIKFIYYNICIENSFDILINILRSLLKILNNIKPIDLPFSTTNVVRKESET